MVLRHLTKALLSATLSGAACLALAGPASAQYNRYTLQQPCAPGQPLVMPYPSAPGYAPMPQQPGQALPQQPGQTSPGQQQAAPQPFDTGLTPEASSAVGGESVALAESNVGYIDSAIPRSQLRIRFDAAYDNNRPDRAEFFYPKCGCFRAGVGTTRDPSAAGPVRTERSVDFQEIRTYGELALGNRFSAFLEVPYRFLNPVVNLNTSGLSDIDAGVKYAVIAEDGVYLTGQLRLFFPSGDGNRGLGTDHYSLEPGILFNRKLSDRLTLEAELRDWISLDGSDYAGNVLRYGVGLGYDVYRSCNRRVTPVVEFVGWTVLDGKETSDVTGLPVSASGDTIINAKLGVRFGLGEHRQLYVGYGRALTGEVWYKDMFRVEYRMTF